MAFWLDIGLLLRLRAALDPNPRKRQMTRLEIQWSQPYSSTLMSLSATVVTALLSATSSYYYLQAITSLIADQVNYFPRYPIKASICKVFPIDLLRSLCFLLSDGHARSSYAPFTLGRCRRKGRASALWPDGVSKDWGQVVVTEGIGMRAERKNKQASQARAHSKKKHPFFIFINNSRIVLTPVN